MIVDATSSSGEVSRCAGDRGSGMVVGLTIMFAVTFLALIWLARDVDRGLSNQSAAQSIAFQAARAGAQQADVDALRAGDATALDTAAARAAASQVAQQLFTSYEVNGSIASIVIDGTEAKVTVTVTIIDGGTTVVGAGSARAERST